jgi:peroxiredoxin
MVSFSLMNETTALPQVGSTLADFELADTDNQPRHLRELAARGALVVVFYRGHW